jgi:cytosine/adenosine deaminase-related metal-dependent hydrolase
MLILADAVLEFLGKIHRPGCIRLHNDSISEVGSSLPPHPGEEVLRLPGLTLTPGFINLHAHLELSSLANTLSPTNTFTDWLRQIIPLLPGLTPEVRRHSITQSSQNALLSGTTSILSITSDVSGLAGLTSTATRVWWALEFMDLHAPAHPAKRLDRVTAWLARHPSSAWHLALSPHAPYTASPTLFQELAQLSTHRHLPFTTHLAESNEETQLLCGEKTPLQNLLPADLKRDDFSGNRSALDWCQRNQALPTRPILAHLNELSESDLPYLRETHATVVHCPSAHRWFQRKPFLSDLLRENQIPICIGTDSPASSPNLHLDLRQEIRLFQETSPSLTPQEAWASLTTSPARALQLEDKLGTLQVGRWADWIGWQIPAHQDPVSWILQSRDPAQVSCVAGRITQHDPI